jgi:hypothetical protein
MVAAKPPPPTRDSSSTPSFLSRPSDEGADWE